MGKLKNFFKPNYPDLFLLIAGCLIGLSRSFRNLSSKLIAFAVAIVLVLLMPYVRRKEEVAQKQETVDEHIQQD